MLWSKQIAARTLQGVSNDAALTRHGGRPWHILNRGCMYDHAAVWSGDRCDAGNLVVGGSSRAAGLAHECLARASDVPIPVRCCADLVAAEPASSEAPPAPPLPPPTPPQDCSALRWPLRSGATVCAKSAIGPYPGVCLETESASAAAAHCASVGARLCTESELSAGYARATGCGFDNQIVWTSTPCAPTGCTSLGGRRLGPGKPGGAQAGAKLEWACGLPVLDGGVKAAVRCCAPPALPVLAKLVVIADRGAVTDARSPVDCATLGKPTSHFGAKKLCAASPGCRSAYSAASAAAVCTSAKMRLCDLDEVAAGAGTGTGCNFDTVQVWTSTLCEADAGNGTRAEGSAVTRGARRMSAATAPTECAPGGKSLKPIAVRCCGDE